MNVQAQKLAEVTEVAGRNRPTTPIYLDYQATTPTDPRVVEAMLPYFTLKFGNPHSRNHQFGWESEEAVEKAREQIGSIIGADPREVIFTSGATESNNLALKGVMRFHKDKKNHLITCVTEHKCVLDSARHLEMEGVVRMNKSDLLATLSSVKGQPFSNAMPPWQEQLSEPERWMVVHYIRSLRRGRL
jgi:selenocysteine lyase/cysteine desulfurase